MIVSFSDLWFPKRDYWTQSILKKRRKQKKKARMNTSLLGRTSLSLCYTCKELQNTKELQNRMLTSPLSAQLPVLWAYQFPICKMGIEIHPLPLTIKAIHLFPCIYTSSPLQCYDDTNFYRKKKKQNETDTTLRNQYFWGAQIPQLGSRISLVPI